MQMKASMWLDWFLDLDTSRRDLIQPQEHIEVKNHLFLAYRKWNSEG